MNKFEIKCLECGSTDVCVSAIDYEHNVATKFMFTCNACENVEEMEGD